MKTSQNQKLVRGLTLNTRVASGLAKLTVRAIILLVAALPAHSAFSQGSLTPPGVPAPTMKSLDQIEPRRVISSLPFTIDVPGSYYLTGNLTGTANSVGISITVSNVTLDLNGFKLSGPGTTGVAFGLLAQTGVVIRNGTIDGWLTGITSTEFGCPVSVDNIWARSNSANGILVGPRSVVQSCTVSNCGTSANGRGILVGEGSIISKCIVSGTSGSSGTAIFAGAGSLIVDCTASRNNAAGGNAIETTESSIVRCQASNNNGTAAAISAGSNSRVVDCTSSTNTGTDNDGIRANKRTHITGCNAFDNGGTGIRVSQDDCVLTGNTASSNTKHGFDIAGARNRIEANQANGNTLVGFNVNNGTTSVGNLVIRNSSGANGGVEFSIALGNATGPFLDKASVTTTDSPTANFDLD